MWRKSQHVRKTNTTIRPETRDDSPERRKPDPGGVLERLPPRLRGALCAALPTGSDPAFVPELDLVMERDGELIGQVIYVRVGDRLRRRAEACPIMAFGPIGIAPAVSATGATESGCSKSRSFFVPIPLAVFPVLHDLFAAIWMGNFPAAILMVIFGTAHMRAAFCSTCRRISNR